MDYPQAGSSIFVRGSERFEAIATTLKVAVATLREAEVPFVLAGSFAAWARGGPEPQKDLDLMLRPEHAEAALERWSGRACDPSARRRNGCSRHGTATC